MKSWSFVRLLAVAASIAVTVGAIAPAAEAQGQSGGPVVAEAVGEDSLASANVTGDKVLEIASGPLFLTSADRSRLGVAASGNCWYAYRYKEWKYGPVNTGNTWTQLNWCNNSSNTAIASYWSSNTGCQAQQAGDCTGWSGPWWMWASGAHREIRMAVNYHFTFPGNVKGNPCMQLRGTFNGLVFDMGNTCNLQ